jgi:cytochrome c-type biogenesis protein CcmE
MTRKRRRLLIVLAAMSGLGIATALVLTAFQDNLVFFYSPSDAVAKDVQPGRRFRLGGLVEEHSVEKEADGVTTKFRVTDLKSAMDVTYKGVLPDLFREGQGVVAEGHLEKGGQFVATEVLARHDEKYMPPEVAASLKKAGVWQGDGNYKPPSAAAKAANP